MLRRLFAPLLAVLALLVSAGCADDVSPAARVGDTAIGNDDFLDEVAEWVANPAAVGPSPLEGSPPGTYPLDLVRQLLQQRIGFELHNAEFEDLGLDLDDDLREQALAGLFGDAEAAREPLSAFSDDFESALVDDLARQVGVQMELGDGYEDWLVGAFGDGIDVNPRYGTWDASTGEIRPPEGPAQPVPTQP